MASVASRVIPYEPRGSAVEVFKSRDPFLVVGGPVRTGKSRGILEYVHLCCMKYAGLRVLFVRQTMASLRETVLQTYEDDVLGETSLAPRVIGSADRGNRTVYQYPNGSRIQLIGMADINRVLSSEFDLIYICQLEECSFDDVQKLRTRMTGKVLLDNAGYPPRIIADCNPGAPTHWIKEAAKTGWLRLIESSFEENPRWFRLHSGRWDKRLEKLVDITGEWTEDGARLIGELDKLVGYVKDRMRYGLWVSAEGARWPFLDPRVHQFRMAERFPYGLPMAYKKLLGVDFGTASPYAAIWMAIDEDRNVFVYREDYAKGIGAVEQAQRVIEKTGRNEEIEGVYPDPATYAKVQDPIRDPGKPIQTLTVADTYSAEFGKDARFGPVVKIRGDSGRRKDGFDILTTLLTRNNGYPDMWIEEGCTNLWKEMCEAVWWQPNTGPIREDIDPNCADHAITATTFPLLVHYEGAQPQKPEISEITAEQMVQARTREIDERISRRFERAFPERKRKIRV